MPADPDLAAWAEGLGRPDGPFPLLGSGSRADAYPALLWNGTRLRRVGVAPVVALLLLAHVTADGGDDLPDAADGRLDAAVAAGLWVLERLPVAPPGAPADAGLEVLAAAATASVVAGSDLVAVLDLAGTLAVVSPPAVAADADVRAGHALAVGWLAVRLLADGLVAPPDAARTTASSVTGAHLTWPGTWS